MVQTLLIDNYDSFTYNLVALLTEVNGRPPVVVTNDVAWRNVDLTAVDNIVISPGPGDPTVHADFGISARAITDSGLPVLGVCLGHQGVCAAFGARVTRAPQPMHGRLSQIRHDGRDLFAGLPSPMSVVRYHSLIAVELPEEFDVLARTDEGLVMAVRHRHRPLWGVQFHPESIAGEHGAAVLRNFRDLSAARGPDVVGVPAARDAATSPPPAPYAVVHRRIPHLPDAPSLYRQLFAGRRGAFWLDGSAAAPGERFTIMGDATGPRAEYLTYDVSTRRVHVDSAFGGRTSDTTSLFEYLEAQLTRRATTPDASLPCAFQLGYVGYLGYELKAESGGCPAHRSPHPDCALVFADRAVVIDHDGGCSYLLTLQAADDTSPDHAWLDRTAAVLNSIAVELPPADVSTTAVEPLDFSIDANLYRARVEECLDLIGQGQTYEVCLTTTARIARDVEAVATFERARVTNPAPYAALLQFAGLSVISASPERFVRIGHDRTAESKPIKGTRPRGSTPQDDDALRNALRRSEKERAENLMIVDLVRNDLTRVCVPESVHVPSLFGVESFPFVHQLVSTVCGVLSDDVHPVAAVRALFPAGSMTGAPKIRTMEILDRLEGRARGVYSGALGYFSLSGAVDLAVVIRTMIATGDTLEIGIGGAITALSDPAEEYAEIMLKAASWRSALTAPASVPM